MVSPSPEVARRDDYSLVPPLVGGLTWLCSFLGPVFVIYGMRGNNTLTNYEAVGCALASLPPTIIVLLLFMLLERA